MNNNEKKEQDKKLQKCLVHASLFSEFGAPDLAAE